MRERVRLGLHDHQFPTLPESTNYEDCFAARDHVFFSPLHYEPKYAYPLVIWLHREGEDEQQLLELMPLLSLRNYVAVAPRGLPCANGPGYGWPATPEAVTKADTLLFSCIEEARQRRRIATDRVFLAGMGEGGTMALRLALANPQYLAGAVSLEGPLPQGHSPLLRVAEARRLPLWFAHARDSQNYPVEKVCGDLRLLHSAGMHVTMRQYDGTGELLPQMLLDLNAWLMETATGGAAISSVPHCRNA